MRFVRGKNSNAPYSLLEPLLSHGGLNCPSLVTQKAAYDLKLISDLITGPPSTPWKAWMMHDLGLSTAPDHRFARSGLNPFLQNAHTRFYFRTSGGTSQRTMSDRLSDAFRTARSIGIDPRCSFPSKRARLDYPILCHPALPKISTGCSHDRLQALGITTVGDLFFVPQPRLARPIQRIISRLLALFSATPWDPSFVDNVPSPTLNVWPAMRNPSGCIRFLSHPYSIVVTSEYLLSATSKFAPYLLPRNPLVTTPLGVRAAHLWLSTSYASDGPEVHSASASWVSNWAISSSVLLTGLPLTAKLASVASAVFALFSWPTGDVIIHTDSSFITHLASGRLLSLERDGWPSFPWLSLTCSPTPVQVTILFQYFLYLLCSHIGSISSLSSPTNPDDRSKSAKALAVEGRHSHSSFDLGHLRVPPGWVDYAPVLNHQSLSFITSAIVSHRPSPIISHHISSFSDHWMVLMWFSFSTRVDLGAHIPHIWRLNAPPGFKELFWKHMFDSLPIGLSRRANQQLGLVYCPCGTADPVNLYHIFRGCPHFPVSLLFDDVLCPAVIACAPQHESHPSVDPHRWYERWWFPVLCLKRLASCGTSKEECSSICKSVRKREWVVSSFFWILWCHRMKQAHEPDYFFSTDMISAEMRSKFSDDPLDRALLRRKATANKQKKGPR